VPLQADALLARWAEWAPGDPRQVSLSARAIGSYLPIALYLARRFAGRGEPRADLIQVAVVADTDHSLDAVDDRETLRAQLAGRRARDHLVIRMRFYADMTPAQTAAEIGMSQLHVTRLLARTLTHLRGGMLTDDDRDPSYRRYPPFPQCDTVPRPPSRRPLTGIGGPSLCARG
jgi:DNA-directed RNA polymerase specialized sigma subunit